MSTRNSLKSTKAPLRAFSTTFAGTGGKAGEIISGEAREAAGSASGSGVDSKVAKDGRCGPAAVAVVVRAVDGAVDTVVEPVPGRWRDEDISGMLEIDAAVGNDEATVDTLLPV